MPFQFIFHNNIEGFCDDILTIVMSAFSFDNPKCESSSEVEILKQTIEILKKDLVKCKAEIKRLNEKIEFLARTNMLYSDWEHRETQVTSELIRKGIEEHKINKELRAEIESLKAKLKEKNT
jgi:predicted RNase H-like nuclease (RuvC/YqgF family)